MEVLNAMRKYFDQRFKKLDCLSSVRNIKEHMKAA